jgi:hypothetical protein
VGEASGGQRTRTFAAELARAGEARHFIAWLGASAGLRGGALSDLAVAAEALLTDVFLSSPEDDGTLEISSTATGGELRITVRHTYLVHRRMAGLDDIMRRFLDGHEISSTEAVLVKRLG